MDVADSVASKIARIRVSFRIVIFYCRRYSSWAHLLDRLHHLHQCDLTQGFRRSVQNQIDKSRSFHTGTHSVYAL